MKTTAPEIELGGFSGVTESVTCEGGKIERIGWSAKPIEDEAEVCRLFNVNPESFEVLSFRCNLWPQTQKSEGGTIVQIPQYQVRASFRPRRKIIDTAAVMRRLVKEAAKHSYRYRGLRRAPRKHREGILWELSLYDLHLDKLAWGRETGAVDQDLKSATRVMERTAAALLERARARRIERIVFPVGNDFFNSDHTEGGNGGVTAAGTPQDMDGRWQKSFTEGWHLLVTVIERLMEIAPVDVIVVPGNHDREKSYYLGDVLEAWFHRCSKIRVDNEPTARKAYKWGRCLLGYMHGSEVKKPVDAANLMAQQWPEHWAATRWREWHTGHLHHEASRGVKLLDEAPGVKYRVLPALCQPDAWHAAMGFVGSVIAGMSFHWHKERGLIGIDYEPVIDTPT